MTSRELEDAASPAQPLGSSGVTRLLLAWREGDEGALDDLTPIVYDELRNLARRFMSDESRRGVLQTTALVHEAYLRLVGLDVTWEGRRHFFAIAARTMRRVLVDYARQRNAAKRGGGVAPLSLDESLVPLERSSELIALDDALAALMAFDERKGRIVELKFFGGLTLAETAEVLDVSHATVERDLKVAKAWLYREMAQVGEDAGGP